MIISRLQSRSGSWATIVVASLVGFFLASTPWQMPASGLDPSWRAAAEYAYLNNMIFGRDFSFTTGPLSFVYTRYFHTGTFIWVAIATVHAAAVYTAAIWWAPNRKLALIVMLLLVACFAPLDPDALFLSLPFIVFLLAATESAPGWVITILVIGLALSGLAKFSFLLFTLTLLVLGDITAVIFGRRYRWQAALYCVSIVVIYGVSGQPLAALPAFLSGSLDVALGYGQAMANFGWTSHQSVLIGVIASILATTFALMHYATYAARVSCILGLMWFAFSSFKLGNVRLGHQLITWQALAAASCLFIMLPVTRARVMRIAAAAAGIWIFICFGLYRQFTAGFDPTTLMRERGAGVVAQLSASVDWVNPKANFDRLSKQRREAEARLALRDGGESFGTVGSLPWEFSEIIAAGSHFTPSPSLQAYANYTPRVRELTRQYYAGSERPENLFFQLATIDNRLRTIELGPSLISIIAGYDLVRLHSPILGSPLQLHRRAKQRSIEVRAIEEKLASMQEWVAAPGIATGGLILSIRPAELIIGKLLTLLYKQEAFELDLRFANGAIVSSRFFPSLVSDGFLVIPPDMSDAQMFREAENGFRVGHTNPLIALRVRPAAESPVRFSADYILTASAVTMTGDAERPLLPETLPSTAMEGLIRGRVVESPEVRFLEGRLLVHPPSKIIAVMPSGGRLSGEIGFFDGAWQSGKPQPVTFAISTVTHAGTRVLFERTLDPAGRAPDRGPQEFSLDLAQTGQPDEPIELLFETRPQTPWGWTYWSNLKIMQ